MTIRVIGPYPECLYNAVLGRSTNLPTNYREIIENVISTKLRAHDAEIVHQRFRDRRTIREIADDVGSSEARVQARLRRALIKILDCRDIIEFGVSNRVHIRTMLKNLSPTKKIQLMKQTLIEDLMIPHRLLESLRLAGMKTLYDITIIPIESLQDIRGIGECSWKQFHELMDDLGLGPDVLQKLLSAKCLTAVSDRIQ